MGDYFPVYEFGVVKMMKEMATLDNHLKIANKSDKNRQTYTKFHNKQTFRKK